MKTKEELAKTLEAEKEDLRNPETYQKWTEKLRGSHLVVVISLSYNALFDICVVFGGIEAAPYVKAEESYSIFIEDGEIKTSDFGAVFSEVVHFSSDSDKSPARRLMAAVFGELFFLVGHGSFGEIKCQRVSAICKNYREIQHFFR